MVFVFAAYMKIANVVKTHWPTICERHLIADDPYQFEHLTTDQLIDTFIRHPKVKALRNEIIKRLEYDPTLSQEDFERLTKILGAK